jgi:predicted permease
MIGANATPNGVGTNDVFRGGGSVSSMREILDRARHLAGVESAAIASPGPLSGGMVGTTMSLVEPGTSQRDLGTIHTVLVTPGYFATMRTPLLRGRDFSRADSAGAPPAAIVNQRLASLAWPGRDPIGKHFDGMSKGTEVIAISANSRDQEVHQEAAPTVYLAFDQHDWPDGWLELRSSAPLAAIESAVRRIVKSAAPGYQVERASTLELIRDNQLHLERLLAFLSSLFGALGTALALIGIYGLIAYSVKRRTREIGIRISVGAQRRNVLWLFVREAFLLVAAGMSLGLPLALLLARFAGKLLYQVPTSDPLGIAATVTLLGLGGLGASLVPARGATRVNPVEALRYD